MTDWTPEEDEAFNEVEKHSNLGKQILREMGQPYHFEKRPWVGLTMDDINQFETWFDDEEERKGWVDPALIAKYFDAKIKDKNT